MNKKQQKIVPFTMCLYNECLDVTIFIRDYQLIKDGQIEKIISTEILGMVPGKKELTKDTVDAAKIKIEW